MRLGGEPMEGIDEYLLHLSSGGSVTSDTIPVANIDEYNSYTFRDLEPGQRCIEIESDKTCWKGAAGRENQFGAVHK